MELIQTRSYQIFLDSLKTDSTKSNYQYWLNKYLDWKILKNPDIKNHDDLINESQDKIQTDIEDYVMSMGHKGRYAVKVSLYALFHFFAMNRVTLNERLIKKLLPQDDTKSQRQTYTNEDVKLMFNAIELSKIKKHKRWVYKKPRAKALILFFASSGVRLGSIPELRLKHLEKIEYCYCIKVYADTKYEYLTFITPQASKYLDDYLATRTDLTPDSKVFDLGYIAIRQLISRLAIKAQVVNLTKVINESYTFNTKSTRTWKDKPIVHSFRSRFNTILKSDSTINPNAIERMMGHSLIKLDDSYYKPTKEQLYQEYKKGIESLTIQE